MIDYLTDITNVLVIGSGGAGLRAAIEVKKHNLNVQVIGKRPKNDSHTVLAAGGINASFGNLDKEDSWKQHFADTFIEGYEIGDYKAIQIMAKNSKNAVLEIDSWGADLQKLSNGKFDQRFFGAHTYRRTCYSGDYTGQSIIKALLKKANLIGIKINDEQYVTDLLVDDKKCFGAISFNINNGEKTIHYADAVVLCTGGHTRLWRNSSSRKFENFGDGYFLGLKAGCELLDMEMVQFHPTGMVLPKEYCGTLVTEAVRGEGGILVNNIGDRFMEKYDKKRMELSTRDRVAIANYTEIVEGRGTSNGAVFLDISHKSKDFILSKIPKIYRQFVDLQLLDISKEPMEVAPTAHYSMGGLFVNASTHQTKVEGLFAAGEVVGGLHGANRLGGNSLAEILIFGRIAGDCASEYSKTINYQPRSRVVVDSALSNIEEKIKKGENLVIYLQNQLRDIMWTHCGVIKDQANLKNGLKKVQNLKNQSLNADVNTNGNNFTDLINIFDLESSLVTAEATIRSSISRLETRGAHVRKDYPNLDKNFKYNFLISLKSNKLEVTKTNVVDLNNELSNCIKETKEILNFEGKLIE